MLKLIVIDKLITIFSDVMIMKVYYAEDNRF